MNAYNILLILSLSAVLLSAAWAAYYVYCLRRLKALSKRGLEETVDFVMGPGSWMVGALQRRSEIIPFLKESFPVPPRTVAEIGRAGGGTLAMLCRAASPDALVISLDLPGVPMSSPVPFLFKGAWRRPLLNAMRGPRQDLILIDGNSRLPESVERFRAALDGRMLDLLFIDGDHSFEGVKSDYELYSPFVRPGGIIAFHDIQPGYERELGVEVSRFWRESSLPGERREFIEDREQLSYGIGALRLPG